MYLYPMAQTGACGSVTCLSVLEGVNHRYFIFQWKQNTKDHVMGSVMRQDISRHVADVNNTKGGDVLDIDTTIDA
jgi:tRNA-specific adenosine deaminase 3